MIEEVRIALFLAMFATLAWLDLRTREASDVVFVMFGGLGAILYVFDWQDVTLLVLCLMAGSASAASLLWGMRLFGTGDLFAVFAGLVICPVYDGIVPTVLPAFMGGWVLSLVSAVAWNVSLNVSDVMRNGGVFLEVSDGRMRKCAAFFLVHRQRGFERNTFLAEETVVGRRRLKFGMKPPDQEFARTGTTRYVECACPLLLFTAAAAFMLLLAHGHIVSFMA